MPELRTYHATQPLRSITGASVLITGAASGIGAATARLFAAEGALVALTDRDGDGVDRMAAAIRAQGGIARAWGLDVGSNSEIQEVAQAVAGAFVGIDCVVNNAGFAPVASIDTNDYDAIWTRALDVMLTAIPRMVRATLPHLRQSPFPRIVNIASTEAFAATRGLGAYAAAKAGVTGVTRSLAVELGREGITVNCIAPGPIETALTGDIPGENRDIYARRRTALGRYGRGDEVAQMILNLCLPGASYITGAVIAVDGGLLIRNA